MSRSTDIVLLERKVSILSKELGAWVFVSCSFIATFITFTLASLYDVLRSEGFLAVGGIAIVGLWIASAKVAEAFFEARFGFRYNG